MVLLVAGRACVLLRQFHPGEQRFLLDLRPMPRVEDELGTLIESGGGLLDRLVGAVRAKPAPA
jgi:hypothetical protein